MVNMFSADAQGVINKATSMLKEQDVSMNITTRIFYDKQLKDVLVGVLHDLKAYTKNGDVVTITIRSGNTTEE